METVNSEKDIALTWRGYDIYFSLLNISGMNYNVKCKTCAKQYSVNKRASSNLKRHMQVCIK